MPASPSVADNAAHETTRDEWLDAVERLIGEAEGWSHRNGWRPERQRKTVRDDPAGAYDVPQLWVTAGGRVVFLDPTSRFLPGGRGIADLYLWPEMDSVMIPLTDEGWEVHLPMERGDVGRSLWSETAFVRAVRRLVGE